MKSVNMISAMALMGTTRAIAAATYSLDAPNRGQHRRDRHPKKMAGAARASAGGISVGPSKSTSLGFLRRQPTKRGQFSRLQVGPAADIF